jgi:hypothetical protein
MCCQNSQSKVIYQFLVSNNNGINLFPPTRNVIHVIVAEFRTAIRPAIPHLVTLLSHREVYVRWASADALSKFSEQCKTSNFLAWMSLICSCSRISRVNSIRLSTEIRGPP